MRLLATTAAAFTLVTVLAFAQTPPDGSPPKAPEAKRIAGVVTPDRVNDDFEKFAKRREAAGGPVRRGDVFYLWYADNPNEFAALARYSVLFLAVLTQNPEELPVKRVYIRAGDQDTPLLKLSSWRSQNSDKLLATKIYGANREDGFYLFPTAAIFRDGQLQAEGSGTTAPTMRLVQLPINDPPERVGKFPREDPAPEAKPNLKTLRAFISKKTSGFPVPSALP
jgi:hypothetical protein